MGCLLSTNKSNPSSKLHQHSSSFNRAPSPVDVETVKEVLSETPTQNAFSKPENDPKKISSRQNSYKFRPQDHILDLNLTISDDDIDTGVYRRKVVDRSPIKARNRVVSGQLSGELHTVRKSPVRGNEQSPVRVRLLPERNGRGPGFGSTGRPSRVSGNGNVVASRSRSPAKRTGMGCGSGGRNDISRSMSDRRTGKSPGRVGSDLNEKVRKPELRSGRGREESNRFMANTNNDESLENPLVSLECFIFL
uniref:uncharacterized protein LOC122592251 n=1 Tax=Erigeron canadensis TaxID=72917 RepID=UPI001CB9111B|nr:uncharacterized protein LOC122592251 [Erigeron canadensis]